MNNPNIKTYTQKNVLTILAEMNGVYQSEDYDVETVLNNLRLKDVEYGMPFFTEIDSILDDLCGTILQCACLDIDDLHNPDEPFQTLQINTFLNKAQLNRIYSAIANPKATVWCSKFLGYYASALRLLGKYGRVDVIYDDGERLVIAVHEGMVEPKKLEGVEEGGE